MRVLACVKEEPNSDLSFSSTEVRRFTLVASYTPSVFPVSVFQAFCELPNFHISTAVVFVVRDPVRQY